jgi:hypothetical protein
MGVRCIESSSLKFIEKNKKQGFKKSQILEVISIFTIFSYLRFTNWQLAALKEVNRDTLVTTSGWSEKATTSAFGGCRKLD